MSKILELADAYANNGYREGTDSFQSYARETRAALAAEIEKVEAENAELRDALEGLIDDMGFGRILLDTAAVTKARAALGEK